MSHDKKEEKNEKHEFYMRIDDSSAFRRSLLEASKSTLGMLREIIVVKQIVEKKHEKAAQVQKELRELKVLVQKLNEMMPDYSKSELKKQFPEFTLEKKTRDVISEYKDPEPAMKKPLNELDQLSQALADIQKKLSSL